MFRALAVDISVMATPAALPSKGFLYRRVLCVGHIVRKDSERREIRIRNDSGCDIHNRVVIQLWRRRKAREFLHKRVKELVFVMSKGDQVWVLGIGRDSRNVFLRGRCLF